MSESLPARVGAMPRRWWVLAVLVLAQLTDTMDVTIVNIALPTAQRDLGFSNVDRQWVITAYALAFGALLLTGGRLADLLGAKRTLIAGLIGFGVASAVAGSAQVFGVLVAARAFQGAFGALISPSALSLINLTFTDEDARRRAFALYGGISGAGGGVGLFLGGVLTEHLSWRWGLFVNIPIIVVVLIAGSMLIQVPRVRQATSLNVPSAVLAAAGLASLVYGFDRAAEDGWGSSLAIGLLAAGGVLLTAFALLQRALTHPLLPLRIPGDRARGAALIMVGLSTIAMFSVFLFLIYFMQGVLGFTPLASGAAFIPLLVGIVLGAGITSSKPFARTPPGAVFLASGIIGGGGMLLLTRLTAHSTYWADIMPGMVVTSVGVGLAFAISTNLATGKVLPEDAGVASAFLNSVQQIGGSLGVAILSTVASQATTRYLNAHPDSGPAGLLDATIDGYTAAFLVSAIILAGAGTLAGGLISRHRRTKPDLNDHKPTPETDLALDRAN